MDNHKSHFQHCQTGQFLTKENVLYITRSWALVKAATEIVACGKTELTDYTNGKL